MIYFISDVHLGFDKGESDKARENLLIEFLDKIESSCEKLFIVGDLFDYWFEYSSVIPRNYIRTLSKLLALSQSGIPIEYLIGNHDFGHVDFFEKELGIPVFGDDIEREIKGKKFYISHGDGKSNNDIGYRILKKILRNKYCQRLYRLLHPDWGIALASNSSRKSRHYTGKKDFGLSEGMSEFAKSKIDAGFDFVIMGHRHRAEVIDFSNGKYINLGDWLGPATYAVFDGNDVHLKKVDGCC
ncbi:MAG: lpxH [Ignavibacteria bacterium]|nr:lpxH [Ignavibacteria bacterium]